MNSGTLLRKMTQILGNNTVRTVDKTRHHSRGPREHVEPLIQTRDPDNLEGWKLATVELPEWHQAIQAEWHSRNFSQDEANFVNGEMGGFIMPDWEAE